MSSEGPPLPGRATLPGEVLARALGFALVWSVEITARFGETFVGRVPLFLASLGSTALSLGSVALLAQDEPAVRGGRKGVVQGAILVSGPLALLARVLRGQTHHRALGGVTFALLSVALVMLGVLVVRRALGSPPGGVPSRVLASVVTMSMVTSAGVALGPLVADFGPGGSASGRWLTQDLALGAVSSGLVLWLPGFRLSPRAALLSATAWAASVVAAVWLLASNMPLRAILSEHAPVALGVFGAI